MAIDPRFLAGNGRDVYTGNELLVKGCLEVDGGVHLMTGYPGSPVAGFFDILGDLSKLLQDKGVRAFQANNEALGAAAVNGSQMTSCRAVCCLKSVGLHVASDCLALANLAGTHPDGGIVLITGCSHSKVEEIVRATKQYLGDNIELVEGGFHLLPYDATYITNIAHLMKDDLGVHRVAPAHCTGNLAFKIFRDVYGENYNYAGVESEVPFSH